MDAQDARRHVIEAGLSNDLQIAFYNVAEATAADGQLMFSRGVSRDLAKSVTCRTYASLVLQLCHLVNIADAAGNEGWEVLFFSGGRATSQTFRSLIGERLIARGWRRAGFTMTTKGIITTYEDGEFQVPYSRMPILAALMYLMLETVGFVEIDKILSNMLKNPARKKSIGKTANSLSGRLYDYLGAHLRPVQEQAKFEQIVSFLKAETDGDEVEIDDAMILGFWQTQIQSIENKDFRQYRSALRAFVAFAQAIESGRSKIAVAHPAAIGEDRAAGEISPDILPEDLELEDDWKSPLIELDSEPASAIRFLNQQERKDLALIMDWGPLALAWPLSLLRHETFGFTQSRLTQAARAGASGAEISLIASCADTENFTTRIARISELHSRILETLKASAWILRQEHRKQKAENGDDRVIGNQDMEARRAFKKLNRQGFSEDILEVPELVAGHRAGATAMLRLRDQVDQWCNKAQGLDDAPPGLGKLFENDTMCFRDEFNRLYGESS